MAINFYVLTPLYPCNDGKNRTREQLENLEEWVTALRSGLYQQTSGKLSRFRDDVINGSAAPSGYCCLGVCAVLKGVPMAPRFNSLVANQGVDSFLFPTKDDGVIRDNNMPPIDWFRANYGIDEPDGFANLNDIKGQTFRQIADIIEWAFYPQTDTYRTPVNTEEHRD